MVYWIAAAEIIFYLCAIPLELAFCLKSENGVRFGAGFGLFEKRFARNRALSNLDHPRKNKRKISFENLPKSGKLYFRFFKEIHVREFDIAGELSLGDAAATALFCGSLPGLAYGLRPFIPNLSMNIRPCFNTSDIRIDLQCMISLRTGQIILAVIISALDYVNGRIVQWISIRLKAS